MHFFWMFCIECHRLLIQTNFLTALLLQVMCVWSIRHSATLHGCCIIIH